MPAKLNTEIVAAAIAGFEQQKKRLDTQIAELRNLLSPSAIDSNTLAPKKRGRMSAAARSRIAAAQQKRWAAARKQSGPASPTEPARKKRKLSAAGRRAIIEATKRRWAAFRNAQARVCRRRHDATQDQTANRVKNSPCMTKSRLRTGRGAAQLSVRYH